MKDHDDNIFCSNDRNNIPTSTSMIFGLQNGDNESWDRFVHLYSPLISHWCKKPGGVLQRFDCEDILQNVLLKVNSAIKDFDVHREKRSLRAWLRVITRNTVTDYLKKKYQHFETNQILDDSSPFVGVTTAEQEQSEESYERSLLLHQVLDIIRSQVSDIHWEILNLFINAEKTSGEIAEIVNMKPDSVRKVKNRLIKRIRAEYNELGIDEEPLF
ncbi:MAG: sigma-70 family RNA polymerase sigma factor [Thermoguttaceae bacterium]|nr:sigma-70 family RNA polymerase sigma factor [Thermoguttaceae bacterium]